MPSPQPASFTSSPVPKRPTHITLPTRPNQFSPSRSPSHTASPSELFPSPRSGDVPPALSPLDAFALQSRMLSQRLDQGAKSDRRISRLPQSFVAKELAKGRPGYQRSESGGSVEQRRKSAKRGSKRVSRAMKHEEDTENAFKQRTRLATPSLRPKSQYPIIQMDEIEDEEDDAASDASSTYSDSSAYDEDEEDEEMPDEARLAVARDYFESWQRNGLVESPVLSPVLTPRLDTATHLTPPPAGRGVGRSPSPLMSGSPRPTATTHTTSFITLTSTPPRGLSLIGTSTTNRTIQPSLSPTTFQPPFLRSELRKDSGSTAQTSTYSPVSPLFDTNNPIPRSPSMSSDHSGGNSLEPPKFSVNFSRPRSVRNSPRPSCETRPSYESEISLGEKEGGGVFLKGEVCASPVQMEHDVVSRNGWNTSAARSPVVRFEHDNAASPQTRDNDLPHPAPSYIYARYSLQRGRNVSHGATSPDSKIHRFEYQEPTVPNLPPEADFSYPSPSPQYDQGTTFELEAFAPPTLTIPIRSASLEGPQPRLDSLNTSPMLVQQPFARTAPSTPQLGSRPSRPQLRLDTGSGITSSTSLSTTMKSSAKQHLPSPTAHPHQHQHNNHSQPQAPKQKQNQMTPEAHLALAISLHESSDLAKSTYHLRLAARAGLAHAQVLYALALRSGWGVKPDAKAAVEWLRKAVEGCGVEVAGALVDEDAAASAPATKGKGDTAALALAIYELGQCHMQGWGVPTCPVTALRHFEIAGGMGDADAVAKAAECYANGVGCARDMKKAAELWRSAEQLGARDGGRGVKEWWAWKGKYDGIGEAEKDKAVKSKGMWGRKRREKAGA